MTADTTPATPTPEGLAAALALIDAAAPSPYSSSGEDFVRGAVFTVARAAVADAQAKAVAQALIDDDTPWSQAWSDTLDAALDAGEATGEALTAAVARLCALATGAQAGEGAGGS